MMEKPEQSGLGVATQLTESNTTDPAARSHHGRPSLLGVSRSRREKGTARRRTSSTTHRFWKRRHGMPPGLYTEYGKALALLDSADNQMMVMAHTSPVTVLPIANLLPRHFHGEEVVEDLAGRVVAFVGFWASDIKVYLLRGWIDLAGL